MKKLFCVVYKHTYLGNVVECHTAEEATILGIASLKEEFGNSLPSFQVESGGKVETIKDWADLIEEILEFTPEEEEEYRRAEAECERE
jgi:hypothetical protein